MGLQFICVYIICGDNGWNKTAAFEGKVDHINRNPK